MQIADGSQTLKGADHQAISIVHAKQESFDIEFAATDQKSKFDTMFNEVGTSRPLVIVRRPADVESLTYTAIGDNCRYCHFTMPFSYRRVAGEQYMAMLQVEEEG